MATIQWAVQPPRELSARTWANPAGGQNAASVAMHGEYPPIMIGKASATADAQTATSLGAASKTIEYYFTVQPAGLNDPGPWTGVGNFWFQANVALAVQGGMTGVPAGGQSQPLGAIAEVDASATAEIYEVGQAGPVRIWGPTTIQDKQPLVTDRLPETRVNSVLMAAQNIRVTLTNQVDSFILVLSTWVMADAVISPPPDPTLPNAIVPTSSCKLEMSQPTTYACQVELSVI